LQDHAPTNLEAIKKQIFEKWSTIGLLDILKETEFRTGFMFHFSSTASREYMDPREVAPKIKQLKGRNKL